MTDGSLNRVSTANFSSGFGIVKGTKSAGLATVTVSGVDIVMQVPRDLIVADGDPVSFVKNGYQWFVVQRYGVAAPAPTPDNPPPPPPKPVTVYGTKTFTPVETRSRQGSKWRTDNDDVYQGQYGNGNHTGCAFYGNGPRSLNGATVLSASVKVRRRSAGGITAAQDTTLRLVTQKFRPSGAPTLGSTADGPNLRWGQSTTFSIPASWAQAMVDGTAGGLAIFESDGSPYVILDGRSHYSSSFSLTIKWRRTS